MIGQARACASLPVVVTQSNTRPPNPRPSGPRPPNVRQRSPAGTLQHPQAFADLFGWFGWSPGAVSETTAPPHKVHANGKAPAGAPCHTLVVGSGSSKALQEASESQPGGPQPEPRPTGTVTMHAEGGQPTGDNWQQLSEDACINDLVHNFIPSRWNVSRKLGQGSYGIVYLTEDLENGAVPRAVKVLSKKRQKVDPKKVRWKLQNEISLLRCVQPCRVAVRFHEALEDKERLYIVMDACQGGSLQDLMDARGKALEEAEAALAMADIFAFLKACHENQICYADIKPSNFMFASKYDGIHSLAPGQGGLGLKAIDLGCSKVVRPGTLLTKRMGTPAYFAPEAYQLLTGRFPHWPSLKALTTADVMDCVVNRKVPFKEEHWGSLSREALDFTSSLLQHRAGLRLSAEEALKHPWIKMHLGNFEH